MLCRDCEQLFASWDPPWVQIREASIVFDGNGGLADEVWGRVKLAVAGCSSLSRVCGAEEALAMTGGGRRGGGGVEPPRNGAPLAASLQAWGRSGSACLDEAPTQASTVAPSLPSRSSSSSWQPPFQEKGRRLASKLRIAQSRRCPSYRRSQIFRRLLHVDGAVTSPLLQSS